MNRRKVAEVLKAPIIKLSPGWLQPGMYLSSDHSPAWQLMALYPGGGWEAGFSPACYY